MSDDKRLHRKDPERTGPIRSFSEMYSRQTAREHEQSPKNGAAPEDRGAARDEGIGLAYRLIDKHINEGRRSAEALNGKPYNTRTATDSLQEVIERTVRYSSELLPLWIEAMVTAVRVEPARMPPAPPNSNGNGGAREAGAGEGSTAVAIEMISTRPVTVSIDLRENSERMPLAALGLRAIDRSKPELAEIAIEPDADRGIKVRIHVPSSHPAGTYSSVIVNRETGESRGTLTVRVTDP